MSCGIFGGGGGFGVVNCRWLPVTRPLSARTVVTVRRYVVLGVSGFARITVSVVNGPGRVGLRFTPVSAGGAAGSGGSGRLASESARRAESAA